MNDLDAFSMVRQLAQREGLLMGGSSGGVAHAAIEIANGLGGQGSVLGVCPDNGGKYLETIYSDKWMEANGFK